MKKRWPNVIGMAIFLGGMTHSFAVQEAPGGGNQYPLPDGDVSIRSKTIADNFYEGIGGGGESFKGVNLFNLTSTYTVPLGGLNLRGQIGYSAALNYSGNIFPALLADNEKAPPLPVALGWSLRNPFVAVNHRGTTTYRDDVFFCDLGPFGGGQLLQHQATGKYFLADNPSIKIEAVLNNGGGVLDGQFEAWIFTLPNGQKMVFGDADDGVVSNSERVLLQNGNEVIVSSYRLDASKPFIYRWDIRLYTDAPAQGEALGANKILFEYEKPNVVPSAAFPEKVYTAESNVKKIKTVDGSGNEIESLNFFYGQAGVKYYVGFEGGESLTRQKLFGTRSLDKFELIRSGTVCVRASFNYTEIIEGTAPDQNPSGPKRLLSSVGIQMEHNGKMVEHGSFVFAYETGGPFDNGNLKSVVTPEGQKMEFQTGGNVINDLSPPTYTMKNPDDPNETLRLPGGISELEGRYTVRTTCSDRFCYVIVSSKRKEDNGLTYLEIYHNTGRYWHAQPVFRKKITSTWAYSQSGSGFWGDEISVIPMGDRFFIVKRYQSTVEIYDWKGEAFNLSQTFSDFPFSSIIQGRQAEIGISVFPSSNYFLVHHRSVGGNSLNNSRIHVYLENPSTGAWDHLTEDSNCRVNNSNNHGENVKDPARLDKCFEFANTSNVGSQLIHVSVSSSMFTVVDGTKGIVFAFLLNKNGDGFNDLSSTFLAYNGSETVHVTGHPNNLNHFVKEPIHLASDYFVLKTQSETGNSGSSRIHVFHFDGINVQRIAADGLETDELTSGSIYHNRRIWIGPDYFLTSNLRGDIGGRYFKFWKKIWAGPTTFSFSPFSIPLPSLGDGIEFLVETHPKSFHLAYYRNGDHNANPGFPSNPPITYSTGSGTDYHTYLFSIDHNRNPVLLTDDRQPKDERGRKYAQIWYSPTDNILIGKSTWNGANACTPGITCSIEYDDWRFFPFSNTAAPFVSKLSFLPTFLNGDVAFNSQNVQSSFSSLFSRAALIQQSGNQSFVKVQLMFSGPFGVGFASSPRILSVSEFVDPAGVEKRTTTFGIVDSDRRTYNRRTGNMDHEGVTVRTGTGNGHVEYVFFLDEPINPLIGRNRGLSGQVRSRRVHKESGPSTLLSSQTTYFQAPYHSSSWPTHLFVNRIDFVDHNSFGNGLGSLLNQTKFLNYNDGNGAPQFTSQFLGNSKWSVTQTLFNTLNLPTQSVVYDINGFEPAHTEALTYVPNGQPFRNLGGIASSKTEYSTLVPYLGVKSYIWRDPGTSPVNADQPLSDAELKTGTVPVYKLDRGFQLASEITRVNVFNQVVEARSQRTSTQSEYATTFYGGKGSWPEANFSSSRADNCAILLAENGSQSPTSLDLPSSTVDLPARNHVSRWRQVGAVFSASRSHTGNYSLKVVNDSGPIIDLPLKDVVSQSFDYVVSAWIFAEPGSNPVLKLSRRQAIGTPGGVEVDGINGVPVDGSVVFRKWQRWELKVSNAQLRSGGLFNGTGDFIRVFAGTPQTGGTLYVDDLVCRPAQSSFVYRTYNSKGQVTSETDTNHLTRYFDIGYLGNVIAVRDENYRIMGQSGANRLGENQ